MPDAVQAFFDARLRTKGGTHMAREDRDVLSCTSHGLQLSLSTATAEWLLGLSERPDDYESLYSYLHRVILDRAHPFGDLCVGLAGLLRDQLARRGRKNLKELAATLSSGATRLQRLMLETMPPLVEARNIVMEVIRSKMFELVGSELLASVREEHRVEDTVWAKRISLLNRTLPDALGVPEQFHLPGEQLPYAPVVQHLQAVPCFPAPQHKLERFYDAAVAIAPCISRYHQRLGNLAARSPQVDGNSSRTPSHQNLCAYMQEEEEALTHGREEGGLRRARGDSDVGAATAADVGGRTYSHEELAVGTEDLLPLMAYALIRSQLPAVVSELRFIELFLGDDEEVLLGPLGFCLATFQSAVQVVLSMEIPPPAKSDLCTGNTEAAQKEAPADDSDTGSTAVIRSLIASASSAHLEAVASALAASGGSGAEASLKVAVRRMHEEPGGKGGEGGKGGPLLGWGRGKAHEKHSLEPRHRVPPVVVGMVRLLQELAAHLNSRAQLSKKLELKEARALPSDSSSDGDAGAEGLLTRDLACLAVGPHARANLFIVFGQQDVARRSPSGKSPSGKLKRCDDDSPPTPDAVQHPLERGRIGMMAVG